MAEKVTLVADFDGDGTVFRADIVRNLSPHPYVRLTINSGNHQTTVDLGPEDLGNFAHLVAKAQKAAIKALAEKY